MKLTKGTSDYKLDKPIGQIWRTVLKVNGGEKSLAQVGMHDIPMLRRDGNNGLGEPQYVALVMDLADDHAPEPVPGDVVRTLKGTTLQFWPTPDRDYDVTVEYFPPREVM